MMMARTMIAVALLLAGTGMARAGGPDLSTPSKALDAYAKAVLAGDADTAKRAVTGEAGAADLVESQIKASKGLRDLRDALVGQFGEDKVAAQLPTLVTELQAQETRAKADAEAAANATIDGNDATVLISEGAAARLIKLKKIGDEWKVLADAGAKTERTKLDDLRQRLTPVINRAKLGMYATPAEAAKAVGDIYKVEGKTWTVAPEPEPVAETKPAATQTAKKADPIPATGKWSPDWSTPFNGVMTFYRANADGMPGVVERTAIFEDTALSEITIGHAKVIKEIKEFMDALRKIDSTADTIFTKQAAILKTETALVATAAKVKIDEPAGDEMDAPAGLLVPGGDGGQITKIKKTQNGEWHVVVTRAGQKPDEKRAAQLLASIETDMNVYSVLADRAHAGVYKTLQDAQKALKDLVAPAPATANPNRGGRTPSGQFTNGVPRTIHIGGTTGGTSGGATGGTTGGTNSGAGG